MILAQLKPLTQPKTLKIKQGTGQIQSFSQYNSSHGMSSDNIVPFWVSLSFVLCICFLGRCCMVPVVKACDYELNNRRYNRKTDKTTILQ